MTYSAWRHRLGLLTVGATLLLVFMGGLVTSTGSGLAVPDWPLSYGMLMPPMVGGVFFEHGHRMAATAVGFLTLLLAVWTAFDERRAGVVRLAWGALAVVVVQGVLGGLTVLFLLPPAVSVAHACLAQTFFCVAIALAFTLSREWLEAVRTVDTSGLRGAALAATGFTWLQLLLGAVMRHIGAGLAIPDFPLALGRIVPPLESVPVAVHFAHRLTALLVLASVLLLLRRSWRTRDPRFLWPATLALALVGAQIALGAVTVLSGRAVLPATLHVVVGAAVLGTCWFATLRALRHLSGSADEARAVSLFPTVART